MAGFSVELASSQQPSSFATSHSLTLSDAQGIAGWPGCASGRFPPTREPGCCGMVRTAGSRAAVRDDLSCTLPTRVRRDLPRR
jgi:hypothetical protein